MLHANDPYGPPGHPPLMNEISTRATTRDDTPDASPRYQWYVVAVLTLAYVSSFIDRQIMSLLVAPIRRDLGIGDTAMSLLMGLSFAILYTFLGLPIGRLADARSRRGIIAWGIAVWSVMTALCGVVRSYGGLFLARVGVGVGEAALSPAAYSLLADTVPRDRLATALSVYSAGIYIGSGIAMIAGGLVIGWLATASTIVVPLVGAVHAWQTVFFVIGLPGLLIALLLGTVREPPRRAATLAPLAVRETMRYVADNRRTFAAHHVGIAMISFAGYAAMAWIPTVFVRQYGWTTARVGVISGASILVLGTVGIVAGGRVADVLLRRGRSDAKLVTCLVGALGMLASAVALALAPNGTTAAVLLSPLYFFNAFPYGAAAAVVQELAPNRMRAQISASYLFVVNLIGLGLGPTAVALLTDYVFRRDDAVGLSLTIVLVTGLSLATMLLQWGRGSYAATLAYRDRWVRDAGIGDGGPVSTIATRSPIPDPRLGRPRSTHSAASTSSSTTPASPGTASSRR